MRREPRRGPFSGFSLKNWSYTGHQQWSQERIWRTLKGPVLSRAWGPSEDHFLALMADPPWKRRALLIVCIPYNSRAGKLQRGSSCRRCPVAKLNFLLSTRRREQGNVSIVTQKVLERPRNQWRPDTISDQLLIVPALASRICSPSSLQVPFSSKASFSSTSFEKINKKTIINII